MPLGYYTVERFPDGEVAVHPHESVCQKTVFVIQSTSPPVNDHLMELLAFVDACRCRAADQVIAIIPYFGYARSDKRHDGGEPIMASVVADMLQTVGVDRVITPVQFFGSTSECGKGVEGAGNALLGGAALLLLAALNQENSSRNGRVHVSGDRKGCKQEVRLEIYVIESKSLNQILRSLTIRGKKLYGWRSILTLPVCGYPDEV